MQMRVYTVYVRVLRIFAYVNDIMKHCSTPLMMGKFTPAWCCSLMVQRDMHLKLHYERRKGHNEEAY